MLKKFGILLIGSVVLNPCFTSTAHADSEWIKLASTDDGLTWEAKPGSFEISKNKGGTPIAVLTGKVFDKNSSKIELEKWYVSALDCSSQMGKLVTLDVKGDYKYETDFVFGSGSVASSMAEFICAVLSHSIKKANEKSL